MIRDLDLHAHGLRIVERKLGNFLPLPDGRYLRAGEGVTQAEVAKFSKRDAERLPEYQARLDAIADVLRALVLEPPPNITEGGWWKTIPELVRAGKLGKRLLKLDTTLRQELLDLFSISAAEYLDRWFESEPVKALFGFDGIVGNYASPHTPGSAYVLLHHVFGEVNGVKGAWGHAIGGMGAISQAMAKAAIAAGVQIDTQCGVREILVENGRAVGVVTERSDVLHARAIVANVNPKLLYERLLAPSQVPSATRERMANWRCGSGTFRMNVALSRLPNFSCLPGEGEHLQSGIIIAPTLDYMDQAFLDARQCGMSRAPIVEMMIPSIVDDSLAPPGGHVASLFCQQFAPVLPGGRSWDVEREAAADRIIDTVEAYAPGFGASVLGRQILSPLDLERSFGLVGGDIMHGNMSLDQLWSARPVLGHGAYRGPLKGLYMCGAGTHPGGGVTGAPGHNAAHRVLADRSLLGRLLRRG